MEEKGLGDLIYTPEVASGEAISKVESHTPKIEAPDKVKVDKPFEVKISVGPHPSKVEHSIRYIEVFYYEEGRNFNPITIAKINFAPIYTDPAVTIVMRLKKSGVIHVLEYCNLHGLWEGRKKIVVE